MTTQRIQGISAYQIQVQSLSSRVNELSKTGDANSLSMASALKQQMNGIQSKLNEVRASNTIGTNFDKYF